mgnify:CR=1 FL=1
MHDAHACDASVACSDLTDAKVSKQLIKGTDSNSLADRHAAMTALWQATLAAKDVKLGRQTLKLFRKKLKNDTQDNRMRGQELQLAQSDLIPASFRVRLGNPDRGWQWLGQLDSIPVRRQRRRPLPVPAHPG